jgi:hypothetical protein
VSQYDSEIQGGQKRYEHQTYGLGVVVDKELLKSIRFQKRSWVPNWLWKLVATPDYVDLLNAAMMRGAQKEWERQFEAQWPKGEEK